MSGAPLRDLTRIGTAASDGVAAAQVESVGPPDAAEPGGRPNGEVWPGPAALADLSSAGQIAWLRLLLALISLLVALAADLWEGRSQSVLLLALAGYVLYSMVLLASGNRTRALRTMPPYWIDAGWVTVFVALAGSADSPVAALYFFAIVVAAFTGGGAAGTAVTGVCAVLWMIAGMVERPRGLPLDRILLGPLYLLIIGLFVARLGHSFLRHRQRLVLLRDLAAVSNPRFGEGQTVARVLERLRVYYDADAALLVVDERTGTASMRRAVRGNPDAAVLEHPLSARDADMLLGLPAGRLAFGRRRWSRARRAWWGGPSGAETRRAHGDAVPRPGDSHDLEARCVAAATLLECGSFVTVPVDYHDDSRARAYVAARRDRALGPGEAEFLAAVTEQVMHAIRHMRLVDRVALDASAQERRRLARDLHDSVIQPYIGLQIGIGAAVQQVRSGADVAPMLERLLHMTEREIISLRAYTREIEERGDGDGLTGGIRRIASRFSEVTGLRVDVHLPDALTVDDRLGAHVLQIVAEGLSNVRRHTDAEWVAVRVERHGTHLCVSIENSGRTPMPGQPFEPRSIRDRTNALGGTTEVRRRPEGGALVLVEIPV